jgi:hypothetical protein
MKTTIILTVLSLALMFAAVNAVYAKDGPDKPKPMPKPSIRYEVTVHFALPLGINLCNTYWVKVTDEFGRQVAPAQKFVPGISKYVFKESISAVGRIRIASLALSANVDPYACMNILVTKPDAKRDFFMPGRSYSFDLYPSLQKGALDE